MDNFLKLPTVANVVSKSKTPLWLGPNPLSEIPSLKLYSSNLYRAPAQSHGKHSLVISSLSLDTLSYAFDAYLDEAVRLLKKTGHLIIKFKETDAVNLINVKSILGRSILSQFTILEQYKDAQGVIHILLTVNRIHFANYKDKSWSFIVLTNGTRPTQLQSFIDSVQSLAPKAEILVVGGSSTPKGCILVDYDSSKLADIAAKKNYAVSKATHSNILITHDRYTLSPDFFTSFEHFGYDYEYLTIPQRFKDSNEVFPSLATLPNNQFQWQNSVYLGDGHYEAGTYVNGGLFIAKKHLLELHPLNPLNFWNEAEDVEFSWTLRAKGVVARVNHGTLAYTTDKTQADIRNYRSGVVGNPALIGLKKVFFDASTEVIAKIPPEVKSKLRMHPIVKALRAHIQN